MSTDLATRANGTDYGAIERVIATGDLSKLSPDERVNLYRSICDSLGLNPLTQPFQYITLSGKLTLYARKDCTDQLRKLNGVSITSLDAQQVGDIYVVRAQARDKGGREDCATGAVCLTGLRGEALANALMKAETKSKRRVTLSICGLGMLDETEVESVPDAKPFEEPRATSSLTPGGSPETDRVFEGWLKAYLERVEQHWSDYWFKRLDGEPMDVGDCLPSFRLRNHLVKWLGGDASTMKHNHITRMLSTAFAADPLRIKAEAKRYLQSVVFPERVATVEKRFALGADGETGIEDDGAELVSAEDYGGDEPGEETQS